MYLRSWHDEEEEVMMALVKKVLPNRNKCVFLPDETKRTRKCKQQKYKDILSLTLLFP